LFIITGKCGRILSCSRIIGRRSLSRPQAQIWPIIHNRLHKSILRRRRAHGRVGLGVGDLGEPEPSCKVREPLLISLPSMSLYNSLCLGPSILLTSCVRENEKVFEAVCPHHGRRRPAPEPSSNKGTKSERSLQDNRNVAHNFPVALVALTV
jgi:hypothetical protein